MIPAPRQPPSIEELAEFCGVLKRRVERLEGNVRQLLADRTRNALPQPTWRDIEALRADLRRLSQIVETSGPNRPRGPGGAH
jgi:hypothetical protein